MHREIGCHFDNGCDDAKDQEGHDDEPSQDEGGPSQGECSTSAHEETNTSLEYHAIHAIQSADDTHPVPIDPPNAII